MEEIEFDESYVGLSPGIPLHLHFVDHGILNRIITDPVLGWKKNVKTLTFKVDRVNGKRADTTYSVISEKLKAEFEPYLVGEKYRRYEFVLIKDSAGTLPPRIVEVKPI